MIFYDILSSEYSYNLTSENVYIPFLVEFQHGLHLAFAYGSFLIFFLLNIS